MPQLIVLRHGQSEWNLQNRFTGWVDVDLTEQGVQEAKKAGELLRDYQIDVLYTSNLQRAQKTADLALASAGIAVDEIHRDEALNERHYGDLQGLNKAETAEKYGDEQVHIWRRSYDTPPPNGESLKDTQARVLPYVEKNIVPQLKAGKNVMVAAHGNSIRALVMFLEKMSPEEILQVNIPTGVPRVYELSDTLEVLSVAYLGENS